MQHAPFDFLVTLNHDLEGVLDLEVVRGRQVAADKAMRHPRRVRMGPHLMNQVLLRVRHQIRLLKAGPIHLLVRQEIGQRPHIGLIATRLGMELHQAIVSQRIRGKELLVSKACRYEPDLNPTYLEWSRHYGCAVIPARKRKPRDKAKAEAGVLIAERWIIAALRHHVFFSLGEINQAVAELLTRLNDRKFRKLDGSRRELFESVDRPALKPLPAEPFSMGVWKTVRVHPDYHVEVDFHCCSVPFHLVGEALEARLCEKTVEIFRFGKRIATHARSFRRHRHTTLAEHRPPNHEALDWTPQRLIDRGRQFGPSTVAILERIMDSRPHPEQGYRSCMGVLRLGARHSAERLEAACGWALAHHACSYRSVESILNNGLDRRPPQSAPESEAHLSLHANVRGADYYGGCSEVTP